MMTSKYWSRTPFCCALALLSFAACSSKKKDKSAEPGKVSSPTQATATSHAPTGLAEGPHKIVRTRLQKQIRKSARGETYEWQLLDGIEVTGESIKQLYVSRGSYFVSFKAAIQVADRDCLIRWKTELIEGPTGRGPSVESISGAVPARAGESLTVSGVVALSDKEASKVGSASAGFWTLCGDALPRPSALDFAITKTATEQIKLGNAFDLHHTVMEVQSNLAKGIAPSRCHFNLVAEDVNAEGYTLNRDFSTYSLAANTSGQVKLRRTSLEGGSEMDFTEAAKSKRSYLNSVSCVGPWDAEGAQLEGIEFQDLAVHRHQAGAKTASETSRTSFDHSATITNTIGKDCSFRVRYRMLDQEGIPMHKAPVLSEVLHLPKGATVKYRSDKRRLYSWLDQAEEVTTLVVMQARPLVDCKQFDAKQSLATQDLAK